VYEHAYFIDFGSDKAGYIAAFWKNFDWAKAEALYLKVREVTL
jgi:Fe-Mn family superoxide dismutase